MMTTVLEPFLGTDETRPQLTKLHNYKGWTVATDGRVIIGTEGATEGLDESTFMNSGLWELFHFGADRVIDYDFSTVPAIITNPCPLCEGCGKASLCNTCNGEGEKECSECFHVEQCSTCLEEGLVKGGNTDCVECGGDGQIPELQPVEVVPSVNCAATILHKLAVLPGISLHRIQPYVTFGFTFDGGRGACMMCRLPRKVTAE